MNRFAGQAKQEADDAIPCLDRMARRCCFAAAIRDEDGIFGQQG